MTGNEADLWMALHYAMDGNLSVSKRRKLIEEYRSAVLTDAAVEFEKDNDPEVGERLREMAERES